MSKLIEWIRDNRGFFSSSVELRESPLGGLGVFATEDIPENTVLLRIPKEEILSTRTCGISNLLTEYEYFGMEGLVMAYIFEKSLGAQSPWSIFIESIEATPRPDVANLWPEEEKQLLKNTDIDTIGGLDELEISTLFEEAQEFISRCDGMVPTVDYKQYADALIMVSSRAFLVDDFHGLSLVPGACLFNHSDKEDVHFESDFDVCELCGGLYCDCRELKALKMKAAGEMDVDEGQSGDEHASGSENEDNDDDDSDDGSDDDAASAESSADNVCEIRAIRPILAGNEIMNTYGDEPNSVLLSRYGFVIWANQNESINVSRQVLQFCKANDLKSRFKWWKQNFAELCDPEADSWQSVLEVNVHGEVTECFQLLLTVLAMPLKSFVALSKNGKLKDVTDDPRREAILREILQTRFAAFSDGGITSEEYHRIANAASGHKKLALLYIGTSKLCLEKAIAAL